GAGPADPRGPRGDPCPGDGGRAASDAAATDTEPAHSRMTSAASVEGHERPRLFVALRLPGEVVERLVAWQTRLRRGDARLVPRENLHMTVAFLGARPAGDVEPIIGELRAAAAAAEPMELEVRDYRETRSVGMVRFGDRGGRAEAFASDVSARLAARGAHAPERQRAAPPRG